MIMFFSIVFFVKINMKIDIDLENFYNYIVFFVQKIKKEREKL